MSDSRFHLKVEFQIYGEKFEWDSSLNWFSTNGECDERIAEWFVSCHDAAKVAYEHENMVANAKRKKKQTELDELTQLAALKLKYPTA